MEFVLRAPASLAHQSSLFATGGRAIPQVSSADVLGFRPKVSQGRLASIILAHFGHSTEQVVRHEPPLRSQDQFDLRYRLV